MSFKYIKRITPYTRASYFKSVIATARFSASQNFPGGRRHFRAHWQLAELIHQTNINEAHFYGTFKVFFATLRFRVSEPLIFCLTEHCSIINMYRIMYFGKSMFLESSELFYNHLRNNSNIDCSSLHTPTQRSSHYTLLFYKNQ